MSGWTKKQDTIASNPEMKNTGSFLIRSNIAAQLYTYKQSSTIRFFARVCSLSEDLSCKLCKALDKSFVMLIYKINILIPGSFLQSLCLLGHIVCTDCL